MDSNTILYLILVLLSVIIIILFFYRPKQANSGDGSNEKLEKQLAEIQLGLKEDFRLNRKEMADMAQQSRKELNESLKEVRESSNRNMKDFVLEQRQKFDDLKVEQKELTNKTVELLDKIRQQLGTDSEKGREALTKVFDGFKDNLDKNIKSFNDLQKEKFGQLEEKQNKLVENTEKKLEEVRVTVDEKLQKTLNERINQSFETVNKQLESVQKGLGEMQTLAQDVGGLKKVLSNVKMRGGLGEVQLSMLLENILAPDQYEANVKTKASSNDLVEFAIKMPNKDGERNYVWLPIDAKFPKEAYELSQDAYEEGDIEKIASAQKNMEMVIKKMAKDICEKYIDPPNTTDFGIMFLPFEGIYAEVVRKASLLEELQNTYKVMVAGPTNLAAFLNSLQMGFRTLAIQKRSAEVWQVLGSVKKEFDTFGGLLSKAQNNIQQGLNQLDNLVGTRTRAIQRKLREVEVSDDKTELLIDETGAEVIVDDI
jgi:DNA recombination protein RmuC